MILWNPEPENDPLREARGVISGAILSIFMWLVIIVAVFGGCVPRTYAPENRGDGVCFLDGACVPCEDLPEGCVFPPRSAQ